MAAAPGWWHARAEIEVKGRGERGLLGRRVWLNMMVGARLVSTRDPSKVVELTGRAVTMGRGAECEVRIADDRVSTRHCRLMALDGGWTIEDLKSTNRTFVNGELVGERPRWLAPGDIVRLGALDATLFEARFVSERAVERVAEARPAPRVEDEAAGLRKRVAELQAALAERNAEIVRMGVMYRTLQGQLSGQAASSVTAERAGANLARDLEELRDDLAQVRTDHAGCRDAAERAQRRTADLEAQLEARERKARRELNEANLDSKELASKLGVANSELAVVRDALATATANLRTLKDAYDDVLVRLQNGR
jgi:predicted component of type VI protein secretion system